MYESTNAILNNAYILTNIYCINSNKCFCFNNTGEAILYAMIYGLNIFKAVKQLASLAYNLFL